MSIFNVCAGLLSVFVLMVFVRTIFKSRVLSPNTQSQTNLRLLRDQLKELAEDHRVGNLSAEQYELSKAEIEGRVLEEVSREPQKLVVSGKYAKLASVAAILLIPASAAYLYSFIGSPEGQDAAAFVDTQNESFDQSDLQSLADKVIQHIDENPNDVQAWGMLARTYQAMHKFDEAANAWERAYQISPGDPAILVDYAEARGLTVGGDLSGEPADLINRALEIDPDHGKGLALGGTAAFAAGKYQLAIDRWTRLMKANLEDAQLMETLRAGIAEAKIRLVQSGRDGIDQIITAEESNAEQPAVMVSGFVRISNELRDKISAQDVVFIYARSAEGPPMPIAAMRIPVDQLPYSFSFDDSFSLMPNRKLSDFPEFLVGARISKSGNAIRASGDIESSTSLVRKGATVEITIDSTVP
ncbi:MAG: c-type cytochrome biogenesis protein CcmI [Burkholderiales bacterium]|nr:c-type cytochrome biogenesis protein CcmI [Burkholderiales bacterium]